MNVDFISDTTSIARMCSGKIVSKTIECGIASVLSDSREIGERALFVPLVGETFDGHNFIETLCRNKQIVAFLTMDRQYIDIADENGICAIECEDTLVALGEIAHAYREELGPYVVGITGTNGKTTTRELVHSILAQKHTTLKNIKNYNNEIGVPFTLLQLKPEHTHAVIEMGMNHLGEIERLSRIARPSLGLITNIGEGHLEFLGSIENVACAKSEIMFAMKPGSVLYINSETECLDIVTNIARQNEIVIKTFGLGAENDISPDNYTVSDKDLTVTVNGEEYSAPIYGVHNVYNVLAAIAIALEVGLEPSLIRAGLANCTLADHRSNVIDNGYIVIDDTYNSNPLSSRVALKTINEVYPGKRKVAVLSDMLELGETADSLHAEIGRFVVENNFDRLYAWGKLARHYVSGALAAGAGEDDALYYENKEELSRQLKSYLSRGDVVLVKGSRSMKMEEIVNSLISKEE